jgi:hypothetical protein
VTFTSEFGRPKTSVEKQLRYINMSDLGTYGALAFYMSRIYCHTFHTSIDLLVLARTCCTIQNRFCTFECHC